jgi:hypothetical protein
MSSWLVLIGTLLGTIIGTCGTIISQHLTSRSTERVERARRKEERRIERRTAIEEFLEVYQEMERTAGDPGRRSGDLSHRMWFLHNRLTLISSPPLAEPLSDFANKLSSAYWNGAPGDQKFYEHLRPAHRRFREAARAELDALDEAT